MGHWRNRFGPKLDALLGESSEVSLNAPKTGIMFAPLGHSRSTKTLSRHASLPSMLIRGSLTSGDPLIEAEMLFKQTGPLHNYLLSALREAKLTEIVDIQCIQSVGTVR